MIRLTKQRCNRWQERSARLAADLASLRDEMVAYRNEAKGGRYQDLTEAVLHLQAAYDEAVAAGNIARKQAEGWE